nr:fibrohexamerin-like protein 2 [Pseudoips prasinana]
MKAFVCLAFITCFYYCSGDSCDDIVHPCPHLDRGCVGRVFAEQLQCSLRDKIPDSRTIKYLPLNYPRSNSSLEYINAVAKGLNKFTINKFYLNRKTKTLVLEVVFKLIDMEAPITKGYFNRKGKEPIVTSGYTYTLYKNYSLTLTVFNVDGRAHHDLSDFVVFTYVTDASPQFAFKKSFIPTDPEVLREFQIFNDYSTGYILEEETVNQGPLLMSYILPCDLQLSIWG